MKKGSVLNSARDKNEGGAYRIGEGEEELACRDPRV